MLANYLIGLREGVEAGLVVGILVAYLRKVGRTDVLPRLWVGVAIAVAVSLGVGAILTWGPYGLTFQAQEAIGGGFSIIAVGLVTWMIFWMARHARNLKHELQDRLDAALAGAGIGVVVLGTVSVGREGIETALFIWASVNSSGQALLGTIGAALGVLTAIVVSYLIYRGFVHINLARFFTWTGVFLVIVAAGVLSYGIGDLQEAGILPGLGRPVYDLSNVIPPSSWYGTLLQALFNYDAEPTMLQLVAWIAYLVVAMALLVRQVVTRRRPDRAGSPHVPSAHAEPSA